MLHWKTTNGANKWPWIFILTVSHESNDNFLMFLLTQIQYKALMNWGFNPTLTASAPPPYRSSHSSSSTQSAHWRLYNRIVNLSGQVHLVVVKCKSSHLRIFVINWELGGVIMHSFDVVMWCEISSGSYAHTLGGLPSPPTLQYNDGVLRAFHCTVQPAIQLSRSDYNFLGLCVHPATCRLGLQLRSH